MTAWRFERMAIGWVGLFLWLAAAAPAHGQPPLEARIPSEQVAPGGALQIKIEVTEPRPILTGGGSFFSFGEELLGLAVNSATGDAAAAAVVRNGEVRVRLLSPSASLGLDPDYPILTATVPVPVGVPLGARMPLEFVGPLVLLDELGRPYPVSVRGGEAVVVGGASITNVSPGSGVVPAGGTVVVTGTGFDATSEVRVDEVQVAATTVVDSTRLEVVLSSPLDMHGRVVEVRSVATGQRVQYVAYQRTTPLVGSTHPLFAVVEVAHAQRFPTAGIVPFPLPGATEALAIAAQNSGQQATVDLDLELIGPAGERLGRAAASLPPLTHAVLSLAEAFGRSCVTACGVRFTASAPVQILGLVGDTSQDAARPVLAAAETFPSFTIAGSAAEAGVGDPFVLSGTIAPGTLPLVADVYVVLVAPDGSLRSLTAAGLAPGLHPYAAATAVTTPVTSEFLRVAIPPGTPPGTYQWLAALAVPGTLNLVTPISTATLLVR